jgi:O-Antigen ligase
METTQWQGAEVEQIEKRSAFWPVLFCLCLVIPLYFDFGTVRLSLYRIVLLLLLLPCIFNWIAGKAGKKIFADYAMILYALWSVLSMVMTIGFDDAIQPGGVWVIETLGGYFVARVYIRDEHSFRAVVKALVLIVAVLLPLAAIESILDKPIALQFFGSIGKSFAITEMEYRAGLRRAQVVFEHPILFGVFTSSVFSLGLVSVDGAKSGFGALMRGLISGIATFFSLSTGAYLSIIVQGILLSWDYLMRKSKRKWTILTTIFVVVYLLIDALSNRTPVEVFISYLTFNFGNSFNRVLIWQYGTAQIFNTPWFGIGPTDNWERPDWMVASMDNFWLLIAVRHGVPAFLFLALAYASILRNIGKSKLQNAGRIALKKRLLFTIIGISVSICTVHLWNATYALFMFLLGSGLWLLEAEDQVAIAKAHQENDGLEHQESAGSPLE